MTPEDRAFHAPDKINLFQSNYPDCITTVVNKHAYDELLNAYENMKLMVTDAHCAAGVLAGKLAAKSRLLEEEIVRHRDAVEKNQRLTLLVNLKRELLNRYRDGVTVPSQLQVDHDNAEFTFESMELE